VFVCLFVCLFDCWFVNKITGNDYNNNYCTKILETCESEISVRIESRIESADSRLQLQC